MSGFPEGLIVDSFAGGGGASLGIERALGRAVDVAINHDSEAIAMHAANHPAARHFSENVWQVDPRDATGGRPVALAWFSPDCKHFSKAKGAAPVARNIRNLAWIVVLWAERVRPAVIMLENVEEFAGWGPVGLDNRPVAERKGETFRRWVRTLRRLGYAVDWRELRACDYGAPTIRKRLFLIARCDGRPIVWPEPTHGPERALPWRTAAEIIDWSLPCPSIFLTREEARVLGVNRPLAEATMRRIARGVKRYVIDAAAPFIVPITHQGDDRVHAVGEPLRTVTTAHRGEHALVAPFVTKFRGGATGHPLDEPLHTITANSHHSRPGGAAPLGLVAPFLVPRYGERDGQEPRTHAVDVPIPTVVPTANGGSLVAAFLAQHNAGPRPGQPGRPAVAPVSTLTATGAQQAVVASHLINLKGGDRRGGPVDVPCPTVTAGGWHVGEVRAFLMKYYGADQDPRLDDPLHTVTTRDRFGLVMVGGEPYAIVDIGMRMLSPRELFRAQGFGDDYVIAPVVHGRPLTKTAQIRMCGNSVCPPVAEALVRANLGAAALNAGAAA